MICCKCKKNIDFDNAYTCSFCHRDYCDSCALDMGMCACYSELHRYS